MIEIFRTRKSVFPDVMDFLLLLFIHRVKQNV